MNHKEIIKEATAGEITVGFELEIIISVTSFIVGTRNEDYLQSQLHTTYYRQIRISRT